MGSIAKATRRIDYDLGFQGLADALNEREKRKEQQATIEAIGKAYQEWKAGQDRAALANQAGAELLPGGQVTNPFALSNRTGGLANFGNAPTQQSEAQIPDIQTNPVSKEEAYQKAIRNKNLFDTAIAPLLLRASTSPEQTKKVNALSALVNEKTNQLRPSTPDIKAVNPTFDIIDNNTGEIIRSGTPKPITPKEKQPKVVLLRSKPTKYGINRTYGYVDDKGNEVITKEDFERTNFDKQSGEDPDAVKAAEKEIGQTASQIQNIKNLKKTKWDEKQNAYVVPASMLGQGGGGVLNLSQQELDVEKERLKAKALAPLITAAKKRQLMEAIGTIEKNPNLGTLQDKINALGENPTREQIKKAGEDYKALVKEHIKRFLKANPAYADGKDVIENYFDLLSL